VSKVVVAPIQSPRVELGESSEAVQENDRAGAEPGGDSFGAESTVVYCIVRINRTITVRSTSADFLASPQSILRLQYPTPNPYRT
jgi:hypothetical protein